MHTDPRLPPSGMCVAREISYHGELANISAQVYDFINSELTHNKTYAYRLPPTFIEQARGLADYHENGIFSDKDMKGIGNSSLILLKILRIFRSDLYCL